MVGSGVKLLYFSQGYGPHDWRFLDSLSGAGHEVYYLRLTDRVLEERSLPDNVEIVTWSHKPNLFKGIFSYPALWRELRRIVSEITPDIVIAGPVQSVAFLAAMAGCVPLVTMSWGTDMLVDASRSFLMRSITRYTLKRSAAVLGDCQGVAKQVSRFCSLTSDRLVIFPWGVDLDLFTPGTASVELNGKLYWQEKPVLICARTWEPLYGVDVVVKAFSLVRVEWPETRLILLGSGSEEPRIRALIAKLRLNKYVHTPGRVGYDVLPDYFRMADIYVSAADSDGSSVSLLQAMASGLPVVVTEGYGNLEWVRPRRNGWLVPNQNPEAMAVALEEAISNPSQRKEMGSTNRKGVSSKADWHKNFPRLLQIIDRLEAKNCSEREAT